MEQEGKAQMVTCSGKSSNGKRSKQKKVPQRGLGVAQLERIRLEEQQQQQNKSSNQSTSSCCPSNAPFMYPLKSCSTFRANHLAHVNTPTDDFNVRKLWKTCDHLNLAHKYQQAITPSMMNVPTQCSLSSIQIEPPSNQICYGNFSSILQEQEKILGNKRSYPIVDNQPSSSFNFEFLTFYTGNSDQSHSKKLRLAECGMELPSCSSNSILAPKNSKKSMNEINVSNGKFLALSLPPTPSSTFNDFDSKIRDFETNPFQGIDNITNFEAEPSGSSTLCIPFYSFFPPAKEFNYVYDLAPTSTSYYRTNGFNNENVDLNLKL